MLSYPLSIKSQASGEGYLPTKVDKTSSKYEYQALPSSHFEAIKVKKPYSDYVCQHSHEKETKNQMLEPETRPQK